MLDKVSKKLLVSLQEHFESQTDYIPLDYDEIISLSGLSERDVISALDYLEYKGLVEICYYADSNIEYGAALTHYGLHYREFNRLERNARWRERLYGFLSGIVISVITYLITQALAK
ncbi:MAG: hypothetical protein HP061_08995 [Christensenellaceae bacterium]|nr:hypothetical protein [Christensenellaceae bacterium]